MQSLPEKIIDFHVHLFPDRLFDAVRRSFVTSYGWDVIYRFNYREAVDYLESRNISPIVFSNYAHRRDVAERLNEWNISVLDEIPGLYCFAAYHPDDDNALSLAEKALNHPRVLGFKLQILVQRFYPHDKRLFPLYDLVAERNKRILLHIGTGPVGNEFVGIRHFRRLMERNYALNVNVAHMGALEYHEFIEALDDYPNMYLDTSFSFFERLPSMFDLGSEYLEKYRHRIVYGSDFPNLILPREQEIDYLVGLNMSGEFYRKVFYENGRALIENNSE